MTRRAWQMHRAGDLGRLSLGTCPLPAREPNQATVKVAAVGLNFADIFACLGLYSATPKGSFIPGLEFAGTVEIPDDDGLVEQGQAVMGCTRFGGYTERLQVDARALLPLPADWSMEQGAAFPVQAMTAWVAIHELGNLQPDQLVLVHSAAGGVGLQALAIIQQLGGKAIGTVGRPDKLDVLGARGIDPDSIIVRDRKHFARQLDSALERHDRRHFDLVLDSLAGPYFRPAYERLAPFGRQVIFGAASMMPGGKRPGLLKLAIQYLRRPRVDPLALISDNRSVMGFNLIWMWHRLDDMRPMCRRLLELGLGPPHIDSIHPFDQAPKALRHFQSGATAGKVVLQLRDTPG